MPAVVGSRIREARTSRSLSLNEVASRAHISVATLSRIERDKQGLDLTLLLSLCKILHSSPQEMLGDEGAEISDPIAAKIGSMEHEERMKLWHDLASSRRSGRREATRTQMRRLAEQLEELMAQFDYVRAEVEAVRNRIRRR